MTPGAPRTSSGVHHLVERVVAGPDAGTVAVVSGERSVTYAELGQRARAIARSLAEQGVTRGGVVAIRLPRGPEAIAAMLGIWRVGAAYLPLDLDDPPDRVRHVLTVAGVGMLVGEPGDGVPRSLSVLSLQDQPDLPSQGDVPAVHDPHLPAYVIFTSGSTGHPKGALMPHRALVNLLRWHDQARPGSGRLRTAQVCATSFDFSFHEIFSTLSAGGTLVVADDGVRRNPFALAQLLANSGVQRLFAPVTLLEQLARAVADRAEDPADSSRLRLQEVVTTGERLRLSPQMRALFTRTGARLHNHYGATEFQDATTHTLAGDPATWPDVVPVGTPIDGVRVRLLDADLSEVPTGAAGEPCVAGAGVALGYVNEPALTATRFVADPDGDGLLYRTGDLARRRADGVLELLGRADSQVKIRGVRVECAEVEAVLLTHSTVRAAAVVAHQVAGRPRLVAHVVRDPAPGDPCVGRSKELHHHVTRVLPAAMRPEAYVEHAALPLTSSGKVDRGRLSPPATFDRLATTPVTEPRTRTERLLLQAWQSVLDLDGVSVTDSFVDLGGTSLRLVELHAEVGRLLERDVPMTDLLRHSTIETLAQHLDGASPSSAVGGSPTRDAGRGARDRGPQAGAGDVAIIGMAGRFPGAADVAQLWRNLVAGVESVRPLDETSSGGITFGEVPFDEAPREHVRMGAVLPGVEWFDADFFGVSPAQARLLDPQHRLLLECAWEAMEDAGIAPGDASAGEVGVFAGTGMSTYLLNHLMGAVGLGAGRPFTEYDVEQLQLKLGNDPGYLTSRVSHALDLTGPSMTVQAGCATSLVAVHQACRSLLAGESDVALAGGVHVVVPQGVGHLHEPGLMLSADGHTRSFDAEATGTLLGDGCGVVVLKRLADARRDGDRVIAVVKGSAVNNDGAGGLGFVVPSVDRQADVVRRALSVGGVAASFVGYVEAHGTGTALGDPVEVAALTAAYGHRDEVPDQAQGSCAIGSVKTNLGSLEEAAGVTGLIKAALSVHHGTLVPSLHFRRPHPRLQLHRSPFWVVTATQKWDSGAAPRTAGVSALATGGTNCHVVLQSVVDDAAPRSGDHGPQLLCLSARTPAALRELRARYVEALGRPDVDLRDVCFTAAVGRRHFAHRTAVVADDAARARDLLLADALEHVVGPDGARVAFVLGSVAEGQAGPDPEQLRLTVFRHALQECAELAATFLGRPLADLLTAAGSPGTPSHLHRPASFAVQYALARLWQSWGVRPVALLGHGDGEYAAACLAGVLDLRDALALVCAGSDETAGRSRQEVLEGVARAVTYRPPVLPLLCPVTGQQLGPEVAHWRYWVQRRGRPAPGRPVIESEDHQDPPVLLELSPHAARREQLLRSAGEIYTAGAELNWAQVHAHQDGRRVALPTYPWQRQRHWVERRPAPQAVDATPLWHRWVHRTRWDAVPATGRPARGACPARRWIVLSDAGTGSEVARQAAALGVDCTLLPWDEALAPRAPADRLAADVVVAAWAQPATAAVDHGSEAGTASRLLLGLVQRLATRRGARPALCLVTTGSQPVAGRAVTNPGHAAPSGLAGAVAAEHPDLVVVQVDLDPAASLTERAAQICAEAQLAADAPTERRVGHRGPTRYAARLRAEPPPAAAPGRGVVADATYLVTGGLGHLGLEVAHALHDAGARHLVLLGRRGPGAQEEARLADLRRRGTAVLVRSVDVQGAAAVAAAVAGVTTDPDLPPLAGVLHLAGVSDEGRLLLQTPRRLAHVMGARARGAWNLHVATADLPLDLFVLFSSAAGALGTPGQCTAAAANAFLDALAAFRRSTGRPGASIRWGPWASDGTSATPGAARPEVGGGVITPGAGRAALLGLLPGPDGDGVVAVLPDARERGEAAAVGSLRSALATASPERRKPLLTSHVRERVQALVGGAGLTDQSELFEHGLDSLTAILLRRDLQRSLGCALAPTVVAEHPTVASLAGHLMHLVATQGHT